MVAGFERFIRDLIVEQFGEVITKYPNFEFAELPDRLREEAAFAPFRQLVKPPSYLRLGKLVDRIPQLRSACRNLLQDKIQADKLTDIRGNPGPDAVKDTLKKLGMNDVFPSLKARFEKKWSGSITDRFIRDKLEEIVIRRHEVAHSASSLNVSVSDLRKSERFLRILAEVLCVSVAEHLREKFREAK